MSMTMPLITTLVSTLQHKISHNPCFHIQSSYDHTQKPTHEGWDVAPACVQRPSLVEDVTVVRLVTAPVLGLDVSLYVLLAVARMSVESLTSTSVSSPNQCAILVAAQLQ